MEADPDLPVAVHALQLQYGAAPAALARGQLYRRADVSALNFRTTADLPPLDGLVGQQRALGALQFGTQIRKSGLNLFVIGSAGSRMQELVESMLKSSQWDRPAARARVYVKNFAYSP